MMPVRGEAENRQILIVGTGALGTLFASRLAGTGQTVTMLGTWREGLTALSELGARLADLDGTEKRFPVFATDDPQKCRGAKYALVLVKSWQTDRAAHQLAECLSADGLAITLQNGLGNWDILTHQLGAARVALGSTTTGATLLGPGVARAGGEGVVSIEAHPALGPLQEALASAGFKVEVVQDARALIWTKLIINSAINPLTALLRVPNGQLLERPMARSLLRALAQETAAVAFAEQIQLAGVDPAGMVEDVARRTAANHSSMYQDIRRGAPTEIDAICGAVTRAGERHHIPTPINRVCWELVEALAQTPEAASRV